MVMAPKRKKTTKPFQALIDLRESLGLTQSEMAAKLGVAFRSYQYYEAGKPMPEPVAILIRLAMSGDYQIPPARN